MSAAIPGTAARVDSAGVVTKLGAKSAPDEVVTEKDVQDPAKLSRLLVKQLSSVATLKRQFAPRHLDFEDLPLDGAGGATTLQHNFGGRVRWWVVDWASGSAASPILIKSAAPGDVTDSTLVLFSYVAGTATIRVEEAG